MGKSTKQKKFNIHVDQSCLTDSTDLAMSPERNTSNETIVRHDSWAEGDAEEKPEENLEEPGEDTQDSHDDDSEENKARERQIDRIQAQIQAAARAVVESIEKDNYGGNEDSVLSMQTDEGPEPDGTELTYGDGTELTYDGTEDTYDSEDHSHLEDSHLDSHLEGSHLEDSQLEESHLEDSHLEDNHLDDSHLEGSHLEADEVDNGDAAYQSDADIHSQPDEEIHEDNPIYDSVNEEVSELNPDVDASAITVESEHDHKSEADHELEHQEHTSDHEQEPEHKHEELVQSIEHDEDDTKEEEHEVKAEVEEVENSVPKYESENDRGGDSSSHNEGDIDDDVFSRNSGHSARSSLNSCHGLDSSDEPYGQKALTSPAVGEEAGTRRESEVSRIESYMHPIPDAVQHTHHEHTPSKVLARPPFRTPSSVRAMQMSSPTQSIYNASPRSVKRHLPTVSRIGTPSSHTSKNRTPTRFKAKKEQPLVLLHVTVLPLEWPYSHLMSSPELPDTLQDVKENWRLLQEKLGDTVLERGILLPHPQDSYDVLEERLLEALELPVRPRALILKCGHYMGPVELETPSSDEDAEEFWAEKVPQRKWCDICRRDVRLENSGEPEKRRFRVKIYASNGLMHAGAWAAAWREMERVDVEIGPWVESLQHTELEKLAILKPELPAKEDFDDGFEDEEEDQEVVRHVTEPREIQEPTPEIEMASNEDIPEDVLRNVNMSERHEHRAKVEDVPEPQEREKSVADYEKEMQELLLEEEKMRETHIQEPPSPQRPQHSFHAEPRARINEDSLSELLVAAGKVAMRDRKNLAILFLSVLVLVLALRPGPSSPSHLQTADSSMVAPNILATPETQPSPVTPETRVEVTIAAPESTSSKAPEPAVEIPVQITAKKVQRKPRVAKIAPKKQVTKKPVREEAPPARKQEAKVEKPVETVKDIIEEDEIEAVQPEAIAKMPQVEVREGAEEISADMPEQNLNVEVGAIEEVEMVEEVDEDENASEGAEDEAEVIEEDAPIAPELSDSSALDGEFDERPEEEES